ncbi:hypothetical protein JL720_7212 [Aureococcus anophagefferens]|nr:hypothetical protein JL720_7212 [Aureococcus anophagefferens]
MTNETDDDGAGDDGLEICRETYGGDVAVRVACRTSFRGTLLDGGLDRTGLMQWPARVARCLRGRRRLPGDAAGRRGRALRVGARAVGASGVFVLGFVVRGACGRSAAAAAPGCGRRDGGAAAAPCGATVFEFAFAGGGDLACANAPGIWAPRRATATPSSDEWMPFAGAAADALW